jgi:hypothetical protein
MATSTSTNKNTIAAGTAEHCLPSINLGRLISITLLTQTCSLYLSIPVSNSCTPNSSTYLETKYLSWMEKDEVLSSCWHMIFCSLAPVIANLHQPFEIRHLSHSWLFLTTTLPYISRHHFHQEHRSSISHNMQVMMNMMTTRILTAKAKMVPSWLNTLHGIGWLQLCRACQICTIAHKCNE